MNFFAETTKKLIKIKYSKDRVQPFIIRVPLLTMIMQYMSSAAKNSCMHLVLPDLSKSMSTWYLHNH